MGRRKPVFDPAQLLDAIPTLNQAVRREDRAQGTILWVPIQRRWWMGPPLSWFLPFRSEKGVALDALGTQVVGLCDGVRTTEEIIEVFAKEHQIRFHEARLSILSFLKSLVQRNLMVVVAGISEGTRPQA
jgi:hypothetical protein